MLKRLVSLGFLMVLSLSGCGGDDGDSGSGFSVVLADVERVSAPQVAAADAEQLSEGNTAFAFDLYQVLGKASSGENLFFSPHSISTALAMTYAGARGQTEEEMAAALHFALPPNVRAWDWPIRARFVRQASLHPEIRRVGSGP